MNDEKIKNKGLRVVSKDEDDSKNEIEKKDSDKPKSSKENTKVRISSLDDFGELKVPFKIKKEHKKDDSSEIIKEFVIEIEDEEG